MSARGSGHTTRCGQVTRGPGQGRMWRLASPTVRCLLWGQSAPPGGRGAEGETGSPTWSTCCHQLEGIPLPAAVNALQQDVLNLKQAEFAKASCPPVARPNTTCESPSRAWTGTSSPHDSMCGWGEGRRGVSWAGSLCSEGADRRLKPRRRGGPSTAGGPASRCPCSSAGLSSGVFWGGPGSPGGSADPSAALQGRV